MSKAGVAPKCLPLKTFEEVLAWNNNNPDLSFTAATVPLNGHVSIPHDRPKTLVCHDMRGGYLQDSLTQGCTDDSAYRCIYWQHIDTFIYFSHYFVTIPPPCWTNAAHLHDVFMLGTVITEWDDGARHCKLILESRDSYERFAEQLVRIAKAHGFEGWLVNIENPIEEEKVQLLQEFVCFLTMRMHEEIPHSQVIWYDSVTHNGELKWQDEVNEKNEKFFESCDGIFLNYNWNDKKLGQSAARAKSHGRLYDVYVGVDVFGRGCYGGGGFNTNQALEKARSYELSAAIFAPGWVYEKMVDTFAVKENFFWSLLMPQLYTRRVRALPFVSSFCQGQGQRFYQCGTVISEKTWSNPTLQAVQPCLCDDVTAFGVDFHDAFQGGSCLKLHASFHPQKKEQYFRLLACDVPMYSKNLISFVYKNSGYQNFLVTLVLKAVTSDGKEVQLHLEKREEVAETAIPAVCKALHDHDTNWVSKTYALNPKVALTMKEVGVSIGTDITQKAHTFCREATVRLGYLQICQAGEVENKANLRQIEIHNPIFKPNETNSNMIDISCDLSWLCDWTKSTVTADTVLEEPIAKHPKMAPIQKKEEKEMIKNKASSTSPKFLVFYSLINRQNGATSEGRLHGSVIGPNLNQSKSSNKVLYRIHDVSVNLSLVQGVQFTIRPLDVLGEFKDTSYDTVLTLPNFKLA